MISEDTRNDFMNSIYDMFSDDCDNNRANQIIDIFDIATENCIELPCKVGEKLYYFDTSGRIYFGKAEQLILNSVDWLIDMRDLAFNSELLGKRFFLTREEAEQALRESETLA